MNDAILELRMHGGDLVATEGKYHRSCDTHFYNRYKTFQRARTTKQQKEEELLNERAYLELVDWMKAEAANGAKTFPMAELSKLYDERREQFNITSQSHSTRLKEKLLKTFGSDLQEQGAEFGPKTLVFTDGLNSLLQDAKNARQFQMDMQTIQKTAKIIRDDLFQHDGFKFDGNFNKSCQQEAVPSSLKALVSMIIHGTSIKEEYDSQAALTISQLLLFNSKKKENCSPKNVFTRRS